MKLQRQWIQKVIGNQENRPQKSCYAFLRPIFLHFFWGESYFAAVFCAMLRAVSA